jgi:hypothetical protein
LRERGNFANLNYRRSIGRVYITICISFQCKNINWLGYLLNAWDLSGFTSGMILVRDLRLQVGLSRSQAEASVKILAEVMENKFASQQDLKDLEVKVQQINIELQHSIEQAKSDLTIRMGTMLAASIAILTAIQKLV